MDACVTLTKEICGLISNRLDTINEDYINQLEKERVRETLNKNVYGSVFSHTKTETASSVESSEKSSNRSGSTSTHSSKVDAEAELAAKLEQSKAKEKFKHSEHIFTKESEWKLKEAKKCSEIKQREVEMQLEQERAKLQQLQAEKEVAIAAAHVRAYDSIEGFENHNKEINNKTSCLLRKAVS